MSAYVVDPEVIDVIVAGVEHLARSSATAHLLPTSWAALAGQGEKLGRDLLSLNVAAVNERYGEREQPPLYHRTPRLAPDRFVLLKAAHELHYNSAEGEAQETVLFAELTVFCATLAGEIVRDLPAYKNAAVGPGSGWPVPVPEPPAPPVRRETEFLSAAETAKLLRQALARAFPGVKFRVRSKTYSGGASIDVDWIDGPEHTAVDHVAQQFSGATFDGMIDLKEYKPPVELEGHDRPVHFGADFVFCRRYTQEEVAQGWTPFSQEVK
jgi:hypothetical protein